MLLTATYTESGQSCTVDIDAADTTVSLKRRVCEEMFMSSEWDSSVILSALCDGGSTTLDSPRATALSDLDISDTTELLLSVRPHATMALGSLHLPQDVVSISLSASAALCVICTYGGGVEIWDTIHNKRLASRLFHETLALSATLSPCGSWVYLGTRHFSITIWDTDLQYIATFGGHTHYVTDTAITECGVHLISGSDDMSCKVWETEMGVCVQTIRFGGRVVAVETSVEGLCCTAEHSRVTVWEILTGVVLYNTELSEKVNSIRFSPCGNALAVAGRNTSKEYYSADGTLIHTLPPAQSLRYTPKGDWVALTQEEVRTEEGIWVKSGGTVLEVSPCGRYVIVGGGKEVAIVEV